METDDVETDTQYLDNITYSSALTLNNYSKPVTSQSMAVSLLSSRSHQKPLDTVAETTCTFSFHGNTPIHCQMLFLPSANPPSLDTITSTLPTISFPFFDPSKLCPIDFSVPLPISRLAPENSSSQDAPQPSGSRSRAMVPASYFKNQLRLARKHALLRIGLNGSNDERKLLAAVRNTDTEAVTGLLNEGVNPNVSDTKKRTPLHIASSQGAEHIVSLLLAVRADPNRQDILGNTPLHLAVCRGDSKIVKLLIGCGANIHLRDHVNRTPLCIVKSRLCTLRKDKSISTDKLITECQLISSILCAHAVRFPNSEIPVDELCSMMENISTREQVDQIADTIDKMSDLCIDRQEEKVHRTCTEPNSWLSIL
ncbi:ankyrin repeat domain-containing protein 54-like isoform X1 [Biomphalaria glabrata]|uniref:Ankyrin repeat domain-containing protein 54-like n=1 Tax=Biomphalaria glabrata TaxID=6526 RepID=A0A2C9LV35_BIOGL|nr:ankyrin repeat domain-containing protein 54-like [Biomphalaria glabrata]XP_055877332.1 ankyrin repeat domain-containing protein 54-like [Biomphalaria glabrata]XP_055877333.1 ankyrin repeat domain-containing protein 54-like [Biomphalaria glabrata]KAI8764966.1 ankyrin repeat domain-containing protein 54-like isoform X1 [Biomphalaria glabrata]KAI8796895.1 ankyrin repeat domain-containing protein 54 isoform X1 [Biomphalaria glabrata]